MGVNAILCCGAIAHDAPHPVRDVIGQVAPIRKLGTARRVVLKNVGEERVHGSLRLFGRGITAEGLQCGRELIQEEISVVRRLCLVENVAILRIGKIEYGIQEGNGCPVRLQHVAVVRNHNSRPHTDLWIWTECAVGNLQYHAEYVQAGDQVGTGELETTHRAAYVSEERIAAYSREPAVVAGGADQGLIAEGDDGILDDRLATGAEPR